jgi:hypothetical protein
MQTETILKYLIRFTQYASRVTWDTRAKMAQFYKGLNSRIKDAMALRPFPPTWELLINTASQLNDNFRRRAQEKKGQSPEQRFKQNQKKPRHPDKIGWTAFTAIKKNVNGKFQKQGPKRKGKYYNCGKEKHFAAECRLANKVFFSEEPRKSKKNKRKKGNQRKEKVHELRGEKRERDENPGNAPIYFHLLRGRKRSGIGMVIPSDPSPPFRTTENLSGTALNSENLNERHCFNPVYKGWEQVQTKDKAIQKGASEKHKVMFWIVCYDDQCRIYLFKKEGAG